MMIALMSILMNSASAALPKNFRYGGCVGSGPNCGVVAGKLEWTYKTHDFTTSIGPLTGSFGVNIHPFQRIQKLKPLITTGVVIQNKKGFLSFGAGANYRLNRKTIVRPELSYIFMNEFVTFGSTEGLNMGSGIKASVSVMYARKKKKRRQKRR